ncbi:MAG: hypothetical protein U0744_17850 [Gemmataceae bacterium]
MIFTVVWTAYAEDRLADIWLGSSDRDAVNNAADWINYHLRNDPNLKGLSEDGFFFFAFEPLGVWFEISEEDRLVRIVEVGRYSQ